MPSRSNFCLSVALVAVLPAVGQRVSLPATPPPATPPAKTLVPEAERTMHRVVLGLPPNETKLFMLPETASWETRTKDPRVRWLRRQLYRLAFEMGHGQVFRSAPAQTLFFIAVPDPSTNPESLGNEEAVFREYLRERVGWSDGIIDERVRFFKSRVPVVYPQDMAEPISYDESGRLVLGVGTDFDEPYESAVESLARSFPDEFAVRRLPDINTEGGDLALVRLPDGGVGLLIGHNRIERWVRRTRPATRPNSPVSEADIEAGRLAYQRAFGGIETIVIGREALQNPSLNNPEIFHLDMVAMVLGTPRGIVAFVPTYEGSPVDALTHVHLDPADVRRFQGEYDRAARQLAARGYRVARVPFLDHPSRSPVGIGKFVDPRTGRVSVLLGRYPTHMAATDEQNPQTQLQLTLEKLDAAVAAWRKDPSDSRWKGVQAAVAATWQQMDKAVTVASPLFDRQREVYESYGVQVLSLPIYPTGEGGVHCLVLK